MPIIEVLYGQIGSPEPPPVLRYAAGPRSVSFADVLIDKAITTRDGQRSRASARIALAALSSPSEREERLRGQST